MPITAKQRELRKGHLGSSDMAALLGVNRYANAFDVWLDKTGQLSDEDIEAKLDYIAAGNYFEDGVLSWAEKELGPLTRNEPRSAIGFPIESNVDAILIQSGIPVEAKTQGLFGPLVDEWGDAGTDHVPYYIVVQGQTHMLCCDSEICHVAAFLGGRGFQMFHIKRDEVIIDVICEKSIEFWDDYVKPRVPPPDVMPSLEVAKRMKREPKKTVEIDPVLVQHWFNAKEMLKGATGVEEAAKAKILAELGDAEAATYGPEKLLTYFEQTLRTIDSKRLREEKPEIAAKYTNVSTHRVLRDKKPKKKKG